MVVFIMSLGVALLPSITMILLFLATKNEKIGFRPILGHITATVGDIVAVIWIIGGAYFMWASIEPLLWGGFCEFQASTAHIAGTVPYESFRRGTSFVKVCNGYFFSSSHGFLLIEIMAIINLVAWKKMLKHAFMVFGRPERFDWIGKIVSLTE